MGLQVPATLAALGPHKILKLGDLLVEAVDILVKEPREKQCQPRSPRPASPAWTRLAGKTEGELLAVTRPPQRAAGISQALQFCQVRSLQRYKEMKYGLIDVQINDLFTPPPYCPASHHDAKFMVTETLKRPKS